MVDITGGPLSREISRIATNAIHRNTGIDIEVHAGPHVINAHQLLRDDRHSDFENNYRDNRTITIALSLGDVVQKIGPFQDDIKILISTYNDTDEGIKESTMYRAYIRDEIPRNLQSSSSPILDTEESSNRAGIVNVSFSINLIVVEYLDNITIGTVIRPAPPFSILKTMMNLYLGAINLTEDDKIKSLSMYEASNFEARTQTPIPQNTRLVDLPDLLQTKYGGIYSTGLGFYLHNRDLFFWPMYDLKREKYNQKYLHVVMGASTHAGILDKTYLIEGNVVSIIATTPVDVRDDSLGQLNNGGDSVRYLDARKALGAAGKAVDNVFISERASTNTELTAAKTRQPVNIVRSSKSRVTSNVYFELSKIAKRSVVYMRVTWKFSNHDLIIPGMLTKVLYARDGEVFETTGTVVSISTVTQTTKPGMLEKTLVSNSIVTIILDRYDPILEDYIVTANEPLAHTVG